MINAFLNRLIRLWLMDAALGVMILLCLACWRIALIVDFYGTLNPQPTNETWALMALRAFQFDAKACAFLVIPLFALSGISALCGGRLKEAFNTLHAFYGLLVIAVTHFLGFANICFFKEYHAQFNEWIFGLIYDDLGAILWTAWETYPVVWGGLGLSVLTLISWCMFSRFLKAIGALSEVRLEGASIGRLSIMGLVLLGAFGLGLRGSWGHMPLKEQHVDVTTNASLNAFVLNPYMAFYFALREHALRQGALGLETFWPSGDIQEALICLYGRGLNDGEKMEDLWLSTAKGPKAKTTPRHIFLIVMESQDVWPMLPPYDALGLNPYLMKLKAKGLSIEAFLSSGYGTMPSLAAIITGLHDADLNINYQPRSKEPFAPSIAPLFKKLGYKTRFIYGGYLSWQKVGEFCGHQGFDEVIGGGEMGELAGTDWGVEDSVLFDYILTHTPDDEPTFNLIMTSTNHPPYPLTDKRLEELGWNKKAMPHELEDIYDGAIPLRVFAHTWYADRIVGQFVGAVEKTLKDPLFIITGDHNSRKFINETPRAYERRAVPCIFYGPSVLEGVKLPMKMAGDHLDIAPTLVELIAPEGFVYHRVGKDLLDAASGCVGYGRGFIITPGYIADDSDSELQSILPGHEVGDVAGLNQYRKHYDALRALSWWQVFEGQQIFTVRP